MKNSEPTFGDWLKQTRSDEKVSGVELERRTGVSRQFISDLERNVTNPKTGNLIKPSRDVAAKLAKGLGRKPEEGLDAAGFAAPKQEINETNGHTEPFSELSFKYKKLSKKKREAIDRLLEVVDREIDRQMENN